MMQLLKPGQVVQGEPSSLNYQVEKFLGSGGQGEVYRVQVGNKPMALKWYYPHTATEPQRAALEVLVAKGSPSSQFLWPEELANAAGVPGFGYLMRLREQRFKSIVDLMKKRIDPTFRALTTAGLQLADAFWQLHAKGMSYRDISFGNAFFDPTTGEVLVCDNDNVAVDGQVPGVEGTPRFMAPEIVRGEANPSTETDRFSLAVLLFYMLMVNHPLEGKQEASIRCFDLPGMTKLYGTEPVFIFDPDNDSNRPLRGIHDNALIYWQVYPRFLKELFTRSFTRGLRDARNGRVGETEWRAALVRLRDAIAYCGSCGTENFYDPETPRVEGQRPPCCRCKKELLLPPHLRLGKTIVMLNHDTRLFPHHLDRNKLYDFSQPWAELERHPTAAVWGLKNLSPQAWVAVMPDGKTQGVEPGRRVTVVPGTRIQFGQVDGEIHAS